MRDYHDINTFIGDHLDDPAYKVCPLSHYAACAHGSLTRTSSHLKDHILGCLRGDNYDGDETEFSADLWCCDLIVKNRIYFHKAIYFNYMTYDMRCDQDSINPRTHIDILVLSHKDDNETHCHLYWYAWVIHVLHVFVQVKKLNGTLTTAKKMGVLCV